MSPSEPPLPYAEASWARATKAPTVNDAFLEPYRERWPVLRGQSWEVLSGGLRSLNIRVGRHVLRVELHGKQQVAMQVAAMARVASQIRVPAVLDHCDDAIVMEHVPHAALSGTDQAGYRVGRAAGVLRGISLERAGFLDATLSVPHPFRSSFDGLRAWGKDLLAGQSAAILGSRTNGLRALWDKSEALLREASGDVVLVHSDFKPANVKWLPEEREVLVLDWELAWAGPPLFDLGMMLRWGATEPFCQAIARGYQDTGHALPKDWQRAAMLFDTFNLVGLLVHAIKGSRRERDLLRRLDLSLSETPA